MYINLLNYIFLLFVYANYYYSQISLNKAIFLETNKYDLKDRLFELLPLTLCQKIYSKLNCPLQKVEDIMIVVLNQVHYNFHFYYF